MPFSTAMKVYGDRAHLVDIDQDKNPALLKFSDGDVWEMPADLDYKVDNFEEGGKVCQLRIKVSHKPTTGPDGTLVHYHAPVYLSPGFGKGYVRAAISRLEQKV